MQQALPSVAQAGVNALNRGRGDITTTITRPDGFVESVDAKYPTLADQATPDAGPVDSETPTNPASNVLATVNPDVPARHQEHTNDCWAAAATMMMNWKNGVSSTIEAAIAPAGQQYLQMYEQDAGLAATTKIDFGSRLGLVAEAPASYPLPQYIDWLNVYGPLWVTTDADAATETFSPHARILVKIAGKGSADGIGTNFTSIDPADGQTVTETFDEFVRAFEQMARIGDPTKPVSAESPLFLQVIHFAETVQRSKGAESWPRRFGQ